MSVNFEALAPALTQQPLKLLDGQHRVVLRAVVEVVRHLGHVPGHGPAQRDPHRLAGRRPHRSRPQRAGHGQQRHGESRGEHGRVGSGRFGSVRVTAECRCLSLSLIRGTDVVLLLSGVQAARGSGRSRFLIPTFTSSSSSIPPSLHLSSLFLPLSPLILHTKTQIPFR